MTARTYMPGNKICSGLGEQGAQGHHAGAFVHADVRELQAALMRIHGTVFEFQADRRSSAAERNSPLVN